VVRVGNLNELSKSLRHKESHKVGNPSFYLSKRGASLEPPWPKPFLGKKDQVSKRSTPGVTSIGSITIHIQLK